MKITKEWLEERNACRDQIAIFMTKWPDGVTITETQLLRATKLGLALDWLALNVLRAQAYLNYDQAKAQAWREYYRVIRVPAGVEYGDVEYPAGVEDERMRNQAWAKYCSVGAQAFMKAMEMEEL